MTCTCKEQNGKCSNCPPQTSDECDWKECAGDLNAELTKVAQERDALIDALETMRAERDAALCGAGKHVLYSDADKDRPDVICDSNGSVTLSMCKRCGKAEVELAPGAAQKEWTEERKQAAAKSLVDALAEHNAQAELADMTNAEALAIAEVGKLKAKVAAMESALNEILWLRKLGDAMTPYANKVEVIAKAVLAPGAAPKPCAYFSTKGFVCNKCGQDHDDPIAQATPAAQPLSDEQIQEIDHRTPGGRTNFARAIETAFAEKNGITLEQQA